MIDFDRLVLGPAMAAFARPVAILPKEGKTYLARGDFREPTEQIALEEGGFTTASPTLGVRRSEFLVLPQQEDEVYVSVRLNAASPVGYEVVAGVTRRFMIVDIRPDGEGDVKLVLSEVSSV